ncbi:MAG: ATP-binding protein [bacterium]
MTSEAEKLPQERVEILIVDHQADNRIAMERLLQWPDVKVLHARSGNEALGLIWERDFAVVLLESQLPEMDGFEVARLIRGNLRTKQVPIIFSMGKRQHCPQNFQEYGSGLIDCLCRPVDPDLLRSKVRTFCRLKQKEQHQLRLLDELRAANAQLEKLDALKTEFISVASHELRTPLTIIKDFVGLVRDEVTGLINAEQADCLDSALRNCDRLATLINDLLDMQRIEAGKRFPLRGRTDIGAILHRCQRDMIPRCQSRDQILELEFQEDLLPVLADADMITQVVVNLVGNAHKFTDAGGLIKIMAANSADSVQVSVSDNGPGIAPEDQTVIFDSFVQGSRRDGPGIRGTGLGLAISKKIVDLHHGELTVTSEPGEGTVFTFTLPLYEPRSALQEFVRDRVGSGHQSGKDWVVILLRPTWTETGAAVQENEVLARIESVARGELRRGADKTLILNELNLLALAFQADPKGGRNLLRRINVRINEQTGGEFQQTAVLLTLAEENMSEIQIDLDTLEFQPLPGESPDPAALLCTEPENAQ